MMPYSWCLAAPAALVLARYFRHRSWWPAAHVARRKAAWAEQPQLSQPADIGRPKPVCLGGACVVGVGAVQLNGSGLHHVPRMMDFVFRYLLAVESSWHMGSV